MGERNILKGVTVYDPERSYEEYTLFCHTHDPPNVALGENLPTCTSSIWREKSSTNGRLRRRFNSLNFCLFCCVR